MIVGNKYYRVALNLKCDVVTIEKITKCFVTYSYYSNVYLSGKITNREKIGGTFSALYFETEKAAIEFIMGELNGKIKVREKQIASFKTEIADLKIKLKNL